MLAGMVNKIAVKGKLQVIIGLVSAGILVKQRKIQSHLPGQVITGITSQAAFFNIHYLGLNSSNREKKQQRKAYTKRGKIFKHIIIFYFGSIRAAIARMYRSWQQASCSLTGIKNTGGTRDQTGTWVAGNLPALPSISYRLSRQGTSWLSATVHPWPIIRFNIRP
jgi:hypothetical protein